MIMAKLTQNKNSGYNSSGFLSELVCFIIAYTKLLAAKDDHPDIAKLRRIPAVPFMDVNIPKNPSINIGSSAYPTVLIILYKGII